jgi:hypothetical protein
VDVVDVIDDQIQYRRPGWSLLDDQVGAAS